MSRYCVWNGGAPQPWTLQIKTPIGAFVSPSMLILSAIDNIDVEVAGVDADWSVFGVSVVVVLLL